MRDISVGLLNEQARGSKRSVCSVKISKPVIPPIGVLGFSFYASLGETDVISAVDLDDGTIVLLRSSGYVKVLHPHQIATPTNWGGDLAWTALPTKIANTTIKAMAASGQTIRIVAVKTTSPYYLYLLESSTGGDSWGDWTQIEQSTFLIADSTDVAMTYQTIFLLSSDYEGAGVEAFWEYSTGTWRRVHRNMLAIPLGDLDASVRTAAARKGETDYLLFSAMPTWARLGTNEKVSQLYYITFKEGFISQETPIAGYEKAVGSAPLLKPGLLVTDGYYIFTGQLSRPSSTVEDDFESYKNSTINLEDKWVSSPANLFILSGLSAVYAKADPSTPEGTYSLYCSGNATSVEQTALWDNKLLNQDFEVVAKGIATEASGGLFGIALRFTDETTGTEDGYAAMVDTIAGGVKLYRYTAGAQTELTSSSFVSSAQTWYSLGVRVLSNNIKFYATADRGSLFTTALIDYSDTDVAARYTEGKVGFMAIGSRAGFDDLTTNAYDLATVDEAVGVGSDPINAARAATYSYDVVGNIVVESQGYLYSFDRNEMTVTRAVSPFASDVVKEKEGLLLDVTDDTSSTTVKNLGNSRPGTFTLNLWSLDD